MGWVVKLNQMRHVTCLAQPLAGLVLAPAWWVRAGAEESSRPESGSSFCLCLRASDLISPNLKFLLFNCGIIIVLNNNC